MEYNANEHELKIIEKPSIGGVTGAYFIYCINSTRYYLLTDGTVPRYISRLHKDMVYFSTKEEAGKFLKDWKKSKEVGAVKKEKKVVVKKKIKRMSAEEFAGALKDI